jgi:hypothetical protein
MARKGRKDYPGGEGRSGGVDIKGSRVQVGGDLVGRDTVTVRGDDRQLEALFAQLDEVIRSTSTLGAAKKQELATASEELKTEVLRPEPDLGKLDRLKRVLLAHGEEVASTVGAIFSYPAVQESLKAAAQRVIGS